MIAEFTFIKLVLTEWHTKRTDDGCQSTRYTLGSIPHIAKLNLSYFQWMNFSFKHQKRLLIQQKQKEIELIQFLLVK